MKKILAGAYGVSQCYLIRCRRFGLAPIAAIIAMSVMALLLAPSEARAQFVCTGSATGAPVDGGGAAATGSSATACGPGATATGDGSAAVGAFAGVGANAGNSENSAFGAFAGQNVNGNSNSAVGNAAGQSVAGNSNLAFGKATGSLVFGNSNSAVGNFAGQIVVGDSNSAFGNGAGQVVTGSNNIAMGTNAGSGTAVSPLVINNTVAIGNSAVASADGAVAIGNGAQATRANQFALGTANNTYTAAGISSAASRAAQSGPTQLVTSDAGGNLATTSLSSLGLASAGDLSAINSRLDDLNNRTSKATTGVAMAFAMAGVPTLMPNETIAMAMNWGTFQGSNGLAFNTAFRISNNVQLNGGIGYGTDERLVGGRVGLRVGW